MYILLSAVLKKGYHARGIVCGVKQSLIGCARARVCVCMRVCVRVWVRARVLVCVCASCVRVCVPARTRARACVCVTEVLKKGYHVRGIVCKQATATAIAIAARPFRQRSTHNLRFDRRPKRSVETHFPHV